MKSKPLKLLGVTSMFTILIVAMVLQCIRMLNLIKLYTLNTFSLLDVNYTSIKKDF